MQQVGIVLGTVGVTLAIIALCGLSLYFYRRKSQQSAQMKDALASAAKAASGLRDAVVEHSNGMNSYLESAKNAVDPLKAVPALVDGMVKIAAAQVQEIGLLRAEVRNLKNLIFKKDDVRAFEQPTDEDKSFVWDLNRILQENPGMQRDEATRRALEIASDSKSGGFSL